VLCSSLHPQLADLMEINWDDRWNRPLEEGRGHSTAERFFVTSVEDHAAVLAAAAAAAAEQEQEQEQSMWRRGGGGMLAVALGGGAVYAYLNNNRSVACSSFNAGVISGSLLIAGASLCYQLSTSTTDTKAIHGTSIMDSDTNPGDTTSCNNPTASSGCKERGGLVYVFVYGTLKRGFQWNQKYLHQRRDPTAKVTYARFVSTAITSNQHMLFVGDCGVPYLSLLPPPYTDTPAEGHSDCGHIVGELWQVSSECLQSLDDYEGVSKGYYKREVIDVRVTAQADCTDTDTHSGDNQQLSLSSELQAFVYHLAAASPEDLQQTATVVTPTAAAAEGNGSILDGVHASLRQPLTTTATNTAATTAATTAAATSTAAATTTASTAAATTTATMPSIPLVEYTLAMHQRLYNPIQHIRVKQLGYIDNKPSAWGHQRQPTRHINPEAAACVE
jgi:gamma-glutamylcyclotransferase (GGCT)/AIG2-like uncharacterized protein YtfP